MRSQRKIGFRFEETLLGQNKDEEDRSQEYAYESSFQLGRFKGGCNNSDEMGPFIIDKDKSKNRTTSKDLILPTHKSTDPTYLPASSNSKFTSKSICSYPKRLLKVFKFVLEDWIYLALLGIIMAIFSMFMDIAIGKLQSLHMYLLDSVISLHWSLPFSIWVLYVVLLITASAMFAHYVAPQAIGSGIPEMKTILRGVILKEYLTIRTLISKIVALTLSLGSGLPIGKEGPFVHVASVVANQLSRLVHGTSGGVFENESRSNEMLAAGCAVGVACTFSAPVGGVLFSIEVTSVYFAVRDYWRGFFAATCSASLFRMLRMFYKASNDGIPKEDGAATLENIVTVEAHYQTHFPAKDAFLPSELPVFALIGLFCGILGALFIYLHRYVVLFLRRNSLVKKIFQKYWLIYPIAVSFLISSITYPMGIGRFIGGQQQFSHTLTEFFVDCSWSLGGNHSQACSNIATPLIELSHWTGPNGDTSVFVTLILFQIAFFCLCILASTLPVPAGIFMPVFVLGAALGRSIGELMTVWFPDGIDPQLPSFHIHPGIYAVVGAAAFCGAVTHTVSVAVIVFELTGQLTHLLPVMIAVIVANAVCSYLQPSIYDSIIKIKHLPYLPNIPNTSSVYHQIQVEQFMVSPVRFVAHDSTYAELQDLLLTMPRLRAFPLVENKGRMTLLGSVSKAQLHRVLEAKVGTRARQAEATRRVRDAIARVDRMFRASRRAESFEGDETVRLSAVGGKDDVIDGKMAKEPDEDPHSRRKSRFTVSKVSNNNLAAGCPDGRKTAVPLSPLLPAAAAPHFNNKILTMEQKEAIFVMGKKRNNNGSAMGGDEGDEGHQKSTDVYHTIGAMFRSITKLSFGRHRKENKENEFDLHGEERKEWEDVVLREAIDLSECHIDPAPFQLVEHTSLFKVHSLFSLLGLNRAYVTECGRLVGVVSRRQLREAIEMAQSGVEPQAGMRLAGGLDLEGERREGKGKGGKREGADRDADDDFIMPRLEVVNRSADNTVDSLSKIMPKPPVLTAEENEVVRAAMVESIRKDSLLPPLPLSPMGKKMSACSSSPCLVSMTNEVGFDPLASALASPSVECEEKSTGDDSLVDDQSSESRKLRRKKKNLHVKIVMPPSHDSD